MAGHVTDHDGDIARGLHHGTVEVAGDPLRAHRRDVAADDVQPPDYGIAVDSDQAPSQLLDQLAAQVVAMPHPLPHDSG